MSIGKPISAAIRIAAINDYHTSGDTASAVAARHGIPRSTFAKWVRGDRAEKIALTGGRWVMDQRRRVQVWVRA